MSKYNSRYPKVRIIRPGKTYSTYLDWYERYFFRSKYTFKLQALPKTGDKGEIVYTAKHSISQNRILYAIAIENQIYIMEDGGFEVIN